MREGWTYKKLGAVATFSSGSRPSGGVRLITQGVLSLGGEHIGKNGHIDLSTPKYVSEQYFKDNTKGHLKNGDILLCKDGALSGKVALVREEIQNNFAMVNEHVYIIRTDSLYQPFLFNFLFSPIGQSELKNRITGAAQGGINGSNLKAIPIPIPPLAEQERIVAELDLLSSIIEKKKAQLEEYDQLAQSIFYDMFGDPVTNEKGWEVKKLGEVYKLKSGDGLSAKQFVNGPYPVYGGNGISGMHNAYNMDGNYIIIGRVGVYCGNVRNVLGKFWLTDNAFQLFYDNSQQSPLFVTHLLSSLNLHQYANQAAQPVISNTTLKEVNIIFPPLSLQQQFAEKIEAIERQKELIKQSIAETETLFNSRMDYYFN